MRQLLMPAVDGRCAVQVCIEAKAAGARPLIIRCRVLVKGALCPIPVLSRLKPRVHPRQDKAAAAGGTLL